MSHSLLRRTVNETLRSEGVSPRTVEVSIALVDDDAMQDLNARYRGKDAPTDVLSFSQEQDIIIPGSPKLLGDVVVSIDTAIRQAEAGNRALDTEVSQLVIHGVLHLLGYDDVTHEGYEEMVRKGATIWRRIECDAGNSD